MALRRPEIEKLRNTLELATAGIPTTYLRDDGVICEQDVAGEMVPVDLAKILSALHAVRAPMLEVIGKLTAELDKRTGEE